MRDGEAQTTTGDLSTDVSKAEDAGVEGNSRLTGATGALLLVLLFVEGLTILRVRELIGVHIFVGLLLIPPVLLKIASTGYRFVRFYTGRAPYVRRGPPNIVLRAIAPLVVASTGALLATGIGLILVSPQHPGLLLFAHKASFIAWFALMTGHVLGHLRETALLASRDWRPSRGRARGRSIRRGIVVLSLIAGVGLGAAVLPSASRWRGAHSVRESNEGAQKR